MAYRNPWARQQSTNRFLRCCSCQGNQETRPLLPNLSTVHHMELKRHRQRHEETTDKRTGQTENKRFKASSERFHFSNTSCYSIASVPSLLNYFSCLIGLWVEDVPGVCHSEIAMFSKCPSRLAWVRWAPNLLSFLRPLNMLCVCACGFVQVLDPVLCMWRGVWLCKKTNVRDMSICSTFKYDSVVLGIFYQLW